MDRVGNGHAVRLGLRHQRRHFLQGEKIAVNPFVPITLNGAPMLVKDGQRIPVGTATIRRVGN